VILISPGFYKEADYRAMLAAAEGSDLDAESEDASWTDIRRGELASNVLQAVCRVNVRNVVDGVCGRASAYVIMPKSPDPRAILAEAFPGALIHEWGLSKPKLSPREQDVANAIIEKLTSAMRVSKKEVTDAVGMKRQQLTPMLKKLAFANFLSANKIEIKSNYFERLSIPGDG